MSPLSYLNNSDIGAFEGLYKQYQKNPNSVDPEWKNFFEGFEFSLADFSKEDIQNTSTDFSTEVVPEKFQKEMAVSNLIGAYRQRGHMFSKTNPVRPRRNHEGEILLKSFGLSEADMDTVFHTGTRVGIGNATLRDIHKPFKKKG